MAPPSARRERAINLPATVTVAIVLLLGIHLCREWLPDEDDALVLLRGAFFPAPWSVAMAWLTPQAAVAGAAAGLEGERAGAIAQLAAYVVQAGPLPWTPLSYALLHGSWTHVGLNAVWLAAFGTPVARRIGGARTVALMLVAAFGGAAAQWLAHPGGTQPLIGASASVSGLMGAAAFFVFDGRAGAVGEEARPASLGALVRNRSAMLFLLVWFVVNLVFAVAAGPFLGADGTIAWEAHVGGLVAGLAVFPVLDRSASRRDLRRA